MCFEKLLLLFTASGSFDSTFSAWDLPHCLPPEED